MNTSVMNMRWFALLSLFMLFMLPAAAVRAQDAVDCQSRDYHQTRCDVDWRDARLVRQLSDTQCVRGQNWGIDRRGLWVDRGCAGRFVEVRRGGGRDRDRDGDGDGDDHGGGGRAWHPGADWDRRFAISCASESYRYTFCSVDLGGGGRASLQRQDSNSPCVEGRTWGYNRAGIWVDQGCSATFTIERRWR